MLRPNRRSAAIDQELQPKGERDKGWFAPPYKAWLWFFDARTFVYLGEQDISADMLTTRQVIHAASYPGGKRLYVLESFADASRGGDYEPRGVLHAYGVETTI